MKTQQNPTKRTTTATNRTDHPAFQRNKSDRRSEGFKNRLQKNKRSRKKIGFEERKQDSLSKISPSFLYTNGGGGRSENIDHVSTFAFLTLDSI